jgi:hypothetical protein
MRRVLSSIFDVFESGSAAEKVVTDIQYVIRFVIGQFQFQYLYGVEGIDESALQSDLMEESESSVGDGVCLVGHFELNGSFGELGRTEEGVEVVGAMSNFLLALVEKIV